MAVKLRLRREGAKKKPHFRVVAADHRSPRDGRFIEILGEYHPAEDPSRIEIDEERALYWLRNGAQPTDQVKTLLRIIGVWETFKPGDAPKRDRSSREAERAAKQAKKAEATRETEEPAAEAETDETAADAPETETPETDTGETDTGETEAPETEAGETLEDAPQAAAPEEVVDEDPESETVEPVAEVQGETEDATAAEPSPTQDADEDTEEQS